MNEAAVKEQVDGLIRSITGSPLADKPGGSLQSICHSELSTEKVSVESSLDFLRLQVKYLLFDLEATRRENRYLRQMLESRHRRDIDDLKSGGEGV
ncbi:MAG TPA: hypothetical protein VM695_15615 [Phycisphaerae bacterium]|nr:hypothetical protein [Phycisphaerae bacterium]